jgi:hypothetical protein
MELPTIPISGMPDTDALRILRYSMVKALNGLGQAVVIVSCQRRDEINPEIIHAIMCINPHTLEIVSAVAQFDNEHVKVDLGNLAGTLVDLAQTLVADHRLELLTPPSRQ